MANVIKIKRSSTPSATPTALEYGELGLNYADGKLFYKDTSNNIVPIGTVSSMNYAQTQAAKQTSISASGVTIVSTSITTKGYPVQILVTGDAENNTAGGWIKLQLYRDSTPIGKIVHVESSAGSENIPYALTVIDTPTTGTYTYSLKTASTSAAGIFNFGETDGPVLTVVELAGATGPAGNTGETGTAGATGVALQGTAPANTNILWADTSVTGVAVVPVGGTTGQMLTKSSGTDYDTAWSTPVTSSDLALKAPLASPTFTGTVTIPAGASISGFAPLASPTFTGTVTIPADSIISLPQIDNFKLGYTTTVTAAGTTTLTNSSNNQQLFTGTTTQTVVMPVASTMTVGTRYIIENNSTGNLTVNSSGGNLIATVFPGMSIRVISILASGTTAASWDSEYAGFSSITGTGSAVMSASPTLTGTPLVAANFSPSATNTYDLGTTSLRWRNIYTQDLHLSNGIGDYTIVEGEESLYILNNKTNKSFKFALIEVESSEVPKLSET